MAAQQKFFNLTAEEVRVDSVLPVFTYSVPLGDNYADSTYTVNLLYPEFIDMSSADVKRLQHVTEHELPETPVVHSTVVVERKKGALEVFFVPLVKRGGKYQKLVSFMLDVSAKSKAGEGLYAKAMRRAAPMERYAAHSVLASGRWAKISVPATGVYQLTDDLIRKAGFTDLTKVHVYGYGGNLQPEKLEGDYLTETDDLKEVPLCLSGGKRLFFGKGPVSWPGSTEMIRVRNPYSDYGCYFITQNDEETAVIDSATFVNSFCLNSEMRTHVLHEVDNFAWFEGGRNLFEDSPITAGNSKTYALKLPKASAGRIRVVLSAGNTSSAEVAVNDSVVGTQSISVTSSLVHGGTSSRGVEYNLRYPLSEVNVTVKTLEGGPIRLDYIVVTSNDPEDIPQLSAVKAVPEYVYNITNQDHHADGQVDMVIIIPTSQRLLEQAERLKAFHEKHDNMRVRIVPADELYNEFSSGTPDVNAYRRYMKMLYDRAGDDDSQMPKYLLLFGDCAWDNRMNSAAWTPFHQDDFLLCYESEDSFSSTDCYVNDGFFCSLDDGEGANPVGADKQDIAVGRFPVRTTEEAKVMVDKVIAYAERNNAGSWENVVMMMGDDGNANLHMGDANDAANLVESLNPGLVVKRVMWDAYAEVVTSTGNTYPDVTTLLKQQQAEGALIMNYSGHGSQRQLSHEQVLTLADFKSFTNKNLPLWITASCDVGPFDSQTENIGEQAVLNPNGGAIAFYGTTRTVYTDRNRRINKAFLRALLTKVNGKYISLGEAQRVAKNSLIQGGMEGYDLTINKLQYSLLGDPALVLNIPDYTVVIDSINGKAVKSTNNIQLKALSVARVSGHIENDGQKATGFNGMLTAIVRDTEEQVTCRMNVSAETKVPFTFNDRTKTLFKGSDSVKDGEFRFQFAVPKDINYGDGTGLMNVYAVDAGTKVAANGYSYDFTVGGTETVENDSIGPAIYCYLNSPSFVNGGNVNVTPYFVAQVSDDDGLNTTGTGIGHDLELIIDGKMSRTYLLNDYFVYDFGSFTSGEVRYSIPALPEGPHTLKFRAWDVKNNCSTAVLNFNVVEGLNPNLFNVDLSRNPASESTTFIITHDRAGSELEVEIDIFDISGRQIWNYVEHGVSPGNTYTVDWNLTVDGGQRLQTGVYLYRVRISSDNSSKVSKAKKLIVMQ